MAYNRKQVQAICSKSEYALFVSSMKGEVEKLPQARVQANIKRTRTLRDKYRDLHKRQRLATRERTGTKKGIKPDTNVRTEQKATIFAEALARLEDRLKAIKAEGRSAGKKATSKKAASKKSVSKKATKKKATKKKVAKKVSKKVAKKKVAKKAVRKKAPAKASRFVSEQAAAASKRQQEQNIRSRAVMGHTSASTKRRQAKRDGGKKE